MHSIADMVEFGTLPCSGPVRNKKQPSPLPLYRAGLIETSLIPAPGGRFSGNAQSHEVMYEGLKSLLRGIV